MSTNKTTNLGLHSWVRSDRFSMDEFNENFDKLDQAVGEKAGQTALDTEAAALAALAGRVGTLEADHLVWKYDTYTGTGDSGPDHPTRIDFDFKPLIVIIGCAENNSGGFPWLRGQKSGRGNYSSGAFNYCTLSWEDHALSWYAAGTGPQLSGRNNTFHYFALGIPD